jgi:hypothetical protein
MMEESMYRAVLAVALSLMFVVLAAPTSDAQVTKGCDPKTQNCLCHNIGGPRDLGANCDMTGNCSFTLPPPIGTITVAPNGFLGIIIGVDQNNAGALAAHLAHGDGFPILLTFDPPLHLASSDANGPHQASNVECLAERVIPQPTEPGN